MNDLNKVNIIGFLGYCRVGHKGKYIAAEANIKITKPFKDKDGNTTYTYAWQNIITYNSETFLDIYILQGKYVNIEGRLDNYKKEGTVLAFKMEKADGQSKQQVIVQVGGRLIKNVSFNEASNGQPAFARLEIASSNYWKDDKKSEWQHNTEYLPIKVFDKRTIEDLKKLAAANVLQKGCYLEVRGDTKHESYTVEKRIKTFNSINVLSKNNILLKPSHELIQLCKENKRFINYLKPTEEALEPKISR